MDYLWFEQKVYELIGVNLQFYKENQMKRRINTLIERLGLDGYESYVNLLKSDSNALKYFQSYITINVTEFFRIPEHWRFLEENVWTKFQNPFVWSTACSTGEEAYSLVISMAEKMPLETIHILASDLDEPSLEKARRGAYSENSLASISQQLKDKYFNRVEKGYQVKDEVKRQIEFRKLDLLQDPYPENCDMIVCRNVLIYLTDLAKQSIYSAIHSSLIPGGYMFTGHTEQLIQYRQMGYEKVTNYLYRKNTY